MPWIFESDRNKQCAGGTDGDETKTSNQEEVDALMSIIAKAKAVQMKEAALNGTTKPMENQMCEGSNQQTGGNNRKWIGGC